MLLPLRKCRRGRCASVLQLAVSFGAAVVLLTSAACAADVDSSGSSPASGECDDASTAPQDGRTLADPAEKDIAMQLVSSAENSTLDWRQQYGYLEDIDDGRGYTGGLVGFTSGTGDMLELVENVIAAEQSSPLASFIPALRAVNGSDSHAGLGTPFEDAWLQSAVDPQYRPGFEAAQDELRDAQYFTPAVDEAVGDGLPILGQFAYYDAAVVHGQDGLDDIRAQALNEADTPAGGGSVTCYLDAFWQARITAMKSEPAHEDVSRITDTQEKFARDGNFSLQTPLEWTVYGDTYRIP